MHKRHKDPRATFKKEHANKDEEALHKTVVGSGVSAMALLEFIIEHEIPRTATVADVVADVILPGTGRAPKVRTNPQHTNPRSVSFGACLLFVRASLLLLWLSVQL